MIVLFLVLNVNKRVEAVREGESRVTEMLGNLRFTALSGDCTCLLGIDYRHQPPRFCFVPSFFTDTWEDADASNLEFDKKKEIKVRITKELSSQLELARRFSTKEVVEICSKMTSFAITGEDVVGSGFAFDFTDSTFLVKYVLAGSSAEAGAKAGDQLVSIDGVMLPDSPTAETILKSYRLSETIHKFYY